MIEPTAKATLFTRPSMNTGFYSILAFPNSNHVGEQANQAHTGRIKPFSFPYSFSFTSAAFNPPTLFMQWCHICCQNRLNSPHVYIIHWGLGSIIIGCQDRTFCPPLPPKCLYKCRILRQQYSLATL